MIPSAQARASATMKTPPLRFFSHEDLEKVFDAALRILDEVGMQIDYPRAQDVLVGEGAKVDSAKKRIYFPPDLVRAKLALMPKRFTYHGRAAEFDYTTAVDGDIAARPAGGCTGYIDLPTGQYRRGGIADWREIVHLADALPNITAVGNMHCGDVPARTSDIHSVRAVLESGRKCAVHGAASVAHFRAQIELLLAVRGLREALAERCQLHEMIAVTNPLSLPADHGEQFFIACEYGIPIDVPVMSIIGITSPITVAGSLAQNLAEELGMITLIQSIRAGHPMAFFLDPVVGNMPHGRSLVRGAGIGPVDCRDVSAWHGTARLAHRGHRLRYRRLQQPADDVSEGAEPDLSGVVWREDDRWRRLHREHYDPQPYPTGHRRRADHDCQAMAARHPS